MSEHDNIRELLSLAAAGALDAQQEAQVARHLAGCAACTEALAGWQELAGSLKRLPTPQPSAALVERTRRCIEAQLATRTEQRWNQGVMAFLVLFSWTITLAGWPIVRLFNEGVASWLDLRFTRSWMALVTYTVLAWLTMGVAAVLLGLQHRHARRRA